MRGGVLVVLLVFLLVCLPFFDRFLWWCCLSGSEEWMWIDDGWSVSWWFDGFVEYAESERLEGVDIALGDKDLLVALWMVGGTSLDRASLSVRH